MCATDIVRVPVRRRVPIPGPRPLAAAGCPARGAGPPLVDVNRGETI